MRWSNLETHRGKLGINVTQEKTHRTLWIPMTAELEAAIATWERKGEFLTPNPVGSGFERTQISSRWGRERKRNPALEPLAGLTVHGLGPTAVVRLKRNGHSVPEIEILGHVE